MVNNTEGTKEALQSSSISSETKIESNQNLETIAADKVVEDNQPIKVADNHNTNHIIEKDIKQVSSTAKNISAPQSALQSAHENSNSEKNEKSDSLNSKGKDPLPTKEEGSDIKGVETPICVPGQDKCENNMQLTVSGSAGSSNTAGGPGNGAVVQGTTSSTSVSSPPGPGPGGISSQHSPGSSSTSSSTSGGGGSGYTRQSNPRPRSYKHNSSINHSSAGTNSSSSKQNNGSNGTINVNKNINSTSIASSTTTMVTSTSLPPSAVSAAPYIPPSHVMIQQPHIDTSYSRAPPPPGLPLNHGGSNHMSHHPHVHASHPAQAHMSPVPPTYCVPPGDPNSGSHPLHGCPPPPPPPGVPPAGASWICYPQYDSSIPPGGPPIPGVPSPHGGTHMPTFVHHIGTQQIPPPPLAQHPPAAITNVQINASSSSNVNGKSSNENTSSKGRSSTPSASISSNNYSHQQSSPSSVTTSCQSTSCAMTSLASTTPTTVVTSGVSHPPPTVMAPPPHIGSPATQPPHVVNYHVHQGEVVSLQMGDGQVEVIHGPATIRMVSTNSSPPMPLPMQVPPGHMVQQVVDQTGTLLHVILSPDPMAMGPGPQPAAPGQPTPMPGSVIPGGGSATPGGSNNGTIGGSNNSGGASSGGTNTPASAPSSIIQPASAGNNGGSTTPQPQPQFVPMTLQYPSGPSNGPHGPLPPSLQGPRQPFPGSTQYGPPPGGPIIPPVTGSHTPTPSSHGASPTPSSGSGGGSSGQFVSGGHPPGYPAYHPGSDGRRPYKQKPRSRNQPPLSSSLAAPSSTTPPTSPRKRGDRDGFRGARESGNNINSNSSSKGKVDSALQNPDDPISDESGVGHEEEEAELLLELLSNIRTPKVSEIQATSALLKWGPPVREDSKFEGLDHITDKSLRYEVLLSDKGRDGKYRSIFTGHSIECRLTDLRPWTEYHIRIHALYETLKGGSSDTVTFCTHACEPDQPAPPKLQNRTKTSLNLRWNAPSDNGAHILHYVLESDEGRGLPYGAPEKYTELFKGRAKSYNITKLQSSTSYRFRLHAVNELGRSRPSEVVTYTTQGTAPMQPQQPGLKEATKSSLHLVWSKRVSDIEFVLHMDDRISGHGYLPVYSGTEMQHICNGLRRNAAYKFRLQAHNEEGKSPWSEEVWYETLPDRPGPPLRPASKGRLHSNSFKVRWDCPSDDGGSPITNYILEIDDSRGWQTVYRGSDLECICDNLRPGTQYKVRVACTSTGGVSDFSDICHICTEPVSPGQCAPPRPHGKPKATSLHLKWGWPETDGGSEVTEFEIDMTSPDNTTRAVYRGHDTECVVASLLPGRPYLFQVRAHNRAGAGPWSESLEVVSGAGAPDQPKAPNVSCRSPTVAHIEWECPINNGAIISEFNLQMAIIATRKCISPPPLNLRSPRRRQHHRTSSMSSNDSLDDEDEYEEDDDDEEEDDDQQSDDESLDSEHEDEDEEKDRQHKRVHHLRKRKRKDNRDADSNDSDSDAETEDGYINSLDRDPASEKDANIDEDTNSDGNIINVNVIEELVKEPEFHTVYTGSQSSYEARNLDPATTYLIRVCATNSAGTSDWSESSQAITPAAPPAAVTGLYLSSSTATSLTLAWERPTANGENITHYNVDNVGLAVVPTPGPDNFFVIDRLKPDTPYTLRVQAVNSVGPGPFSHPATKMSTRPLPPAPPKCELVNANHNSLKLKWGDSKSAATTELCHYTLEMENSRNQFHTIYSGTGVSYKIAKLSENRCYKVRLYASNDAGQGPYSQLYEFKTAYAHPPPLKAAPRVTGITEDGCLVEWSPVKLPPSQGELHYRVQLTKVRESDSKIIYTGSDTQFRVNGLDPKTEYSIRVGGVRVPVPGVEMSGTFSPPGVFTTLPSSSPVNSDLPTEGQRKITTSRTGFIPHKGDKAWTDQQWACVILFGFTLFALCVAVIMQQVIAWGIVTSQ